MGLDELGHLFIWVYYEDDPQSDWEPFEVTGPYFSSITSEGRNVTRDVSYEGTNVEFRYVAIGGNKSD